MVMSSVSTAFKVNYNQKLGGIRPSWGDAPWPLGGIDAPGDMYKNDKIMLLQLRQSPFLSIPIAVFTASLLALKRAGLLATR